MLGEVWLVWQFGVVYEVVQVGGQYLVVEVLVEVEYFGLFVVWLLVELVVFVVDFVQGVGIVEVVEYFVQLGLFGCEEVWYLLIFVLVFYIYFLMGDVQ